MDDFMMWAVPLAFFLCVAAVQAMRKHWQKALLAFLAAGICLALMANAGQTHTSAILRARLHHYESKTKELQLQIETLNGASNQASKAIGALAMSWNQFAQCRK